jgi:hypothetical protein
MCEARDLFTGLPLAPRLDRCRDIGEQEVAGLADDRLLALEGGAEDAWLDAIVERVRLAVPELLRDGAALEVDDDGAEAVLVVPFEGDAALFDARLGIGLIGDNPEPQRPHAAIEDGTVRITMNLTAGRPARSLIGEHLELLDEWLGLLRRLAQEFHEDVASRARMALHERREAYRSRQAFLDDSPVPIRPRRDAPGKFTRSGIRPKRTPLTHRGRRQPSVPGTTAPPPRPVMEKELYEHIITVLRAAGNSMTRAPRTYAGWGEEDRRQALLLMLNSHYEGAAFAEAFNGDGKTDILVRIDDVNVFVAECKFWAGTKVGARTVDQLLGYATWHDTRLAIVFFVRTRSLAPAIEAGKAMLSEHPVFSRWTKAPQPTENEVRCLIRMPGDAAREALLHVFFIHTPPLRRARAA